MGVSDKGRLYKHIFIDKELDIYLFNEDNGVRLIDRY